MLEHNEQPEQETDLGAIFGSLALAFVGLVISYKQTGDFTSLAILGTKQLH